MRKFFLENEYGVRLNLNSPEVGFLTSPSGLGYSMSANYVNIGNSYLNSYMNTNQAEIKGTLVFGGRSPYENYEKYVDFVNSAQKLRIVYVPLTGEYFRDVDMVSIDKGEMGKKKKTKKKTKKRVNIIHKSNILLIFACTRN